VEAGPAEEAPGFAVDAKGFDAKGFDVKSFDVKRFGDEGFIDVVVGGTAGFVAEGRAAGTTSARADGIVGLVPPAAD
jgi:hypothetical protein